MLGRIQRGGLTRGWVSKNIDETPRGEPATAIMGHHRGKAQEVIKEFKGALALDGCLLAGGAGGERYDIARYEPLKTWSA